MWMQLDESGRVVGLRYEEPPEEDRGLWDETDFDFGDDFSDYVVEGGEVVHDPLPAPKRPATPERVISALFEAKPEMLDSMPSEVVEGMAPWFDDWFGEGVRYEPGKLLNHEGTLYRVLQAHGSQSDWDPPSAKSLFARVLTDPGGEALPWEQPGSENPYMRGDRVTFDGKTYESVIDNNARRWDR